MAFNLNLKEIGGRLKQARKALDRTQKELAGLCGMPMSTISEMESGSRKPHPAYLHLLAKEFNVNINWILTGKGAMLLPYFEIKWDFGPDSRRIMEMIYMLENCEPVRYAVLGHYVTFLEANRDQLEKYLPDREKE